MKEEDYYEIIKEVIQQVEQSKHISTEISGIGTISSDISDIGNEIGIAVGKYIVKHNLDKEDFISGIKHGISLKDGTH